MLALAARASWRAEHRAGIARKTELRGAWDPAHVEARMVEAFGVLRRIPDCVWPRGHGNSMPSYLYDRADIQGQGGMMRREFYKERNRTQVTGTPDEIERMNQAIRWPALYLRDAPELAKAVSLGALWVLLRKNVNRECKRMGISRRTFYRRKLHGLMVIATELTSEGAD
jgi:hypothetical protein